MNNRPFTLTGKINLKDDYLICKVTVNKKRENKESFVLVLNQEHLDLFEYGYKAYIFESVPKNVNLESINYCVEINNFDTLIDFDVIKITPGFIRVLYRCDSEDNVIFVTNQCNSNCIMCPDSDVVRKIRSNVSIHELLEYIDDIPSDCPHLTITGGEPGMLKGNLIKVLNECKTKLNNTDFLMLTNGRVLSDKNYRKELINVLPQRFRFGIPLYSSNPTIHDEITRASGSFYQSSLAIKKLIESGIDVEIRIVVLKKNYKVLNDLANYISSNFYQVKMVNFMALEVLGNCLKNKDDVWIDFEEVNPYLKEACITLINNGIEVNLYNFPLCKIDKTLISLCNNSITDYKIKYKEECNNCSAKEYCGGFFSSTINLCEIKVEPFE